MASFDAISLFTNIPQQLAIEAITNRWHEIQPFTTIKKQDFIKLISLCFECSYFISDDTYYKQVFGTAMGSPLSPALAEIVLQYLEQNIFNNIEFDFNYFRYVDDTFIIAPADKIDWLLSKFNGLHDRLKFTVEHEKNDTLNFLDVSVHRFKNSFKTNWFRKDTWSGRYLHFNTYH